MSAEKQEKQSAVSLMKELGARLEDFREDPEQIAAWLRWNNNFTDYSAVNRMYIYAQLPEATQVASYKKWESLGRNVIKGSKSIKIFAPNTFKKRKKDEDEEEDNKKDMVFSFRSIPVFDISQTEGESIDLLPKVQKNSTLDQLAEEVAERLKTLGVSIERYTSSPTMLSGYSNFSVTLNSVHSKEIQNIGIIRSIALYHLNENLKSVFKTELDYAEKSWVANAATWALLERRKIDANEHIGTLLSGYTGERTFKELLTATDQVVTFLDALDEGIPAEWAASIVTNNSSVA